MSIVVSVTQPLYSSSYDFVLGTLRIMLHTSLYNLTHYLHPYQQQQPAHCVNPRRRPPQARLDHPASTSRLPWCCSRDRPPCHFSFPSRVAVGSHVPCHTRDAACWRTITSSPPPRVIHLCLSVRDTYTDAFKGSLPSVPVVMDPGVQASQTLGRLNPATNTPLPPTSRPSPNRPRKPKLQLCFDDTLPWTQDRSA